MRLTSLPVVVGQLTSLTTARITKVRGRMTPPRGRKIPRSKTTALRAAQGRLGAILAVRLVAVTVAVAVAALVVVPALAVAVVAVLVVIAALVVAVRHLALTLPTIRVVAL